MADEPGGALTPEPDAAPAAPAEVVSWRDALPDPLKAEKTLTKFKDVGALANSYVNLEKHIGAAVKIPTEGASPDEWTAYYRKLGVPEKVEDYGVEAKVPEGLPWDKNLEKQFLTKMHARGLTRAQAQGILDDYLVDTNAAYVAQQQAKSASAESAYGEMQKVWGGLTDRNVALVQRTVAEFGGPELKTYLDETGLGNHPAFLSFVHRMAAPMLEDNLIKGEHLGMRREDAKAEIARIMAMPEYRKGDKQLVEKIRDLTTVAYAE